MRILRLFAILIPVVALSACGPTLAQRKEEAGIYHRLGAVHLNDGRLADALTELTKAVEIYPDDPAFHKDLGLAYFFKGMLPEAAREMKKAIALDSKYAEARVALSAVYLDEKNWDGAIAESKKALENIFYRTPEFAHHNIGWANFNKGDYKAALESFRRAIDANPGYAPGYYYTGLAYERLSRPKDSIEALELAVKNAPNYVDAYMALGRLYMAQNETVAARRAFERVTEIAPASELAAAAREQLRGLKSRP